MSATVFVLVPHGHDAGEVLAALPPAERERAAALALRRYPRADDARHLRSLVRAGRDPRATRWRRGLLLAIAAGAALGLVVQAVLALGFGMLGGLLEVALPLGLLLGAFLGGFTAAMTGTEAPRPELAALWPHVRAGDVLHQWSGDDRAALMALAAAAARSGFAAAAID